jgi:predicted amidohydrolase YtcJ
MVHTLGDRALQQFIRIYRGLYTDQTPNNQLGHTVEHVEVIDDELINDLIHTGLWVSAQPNFAGRWSVAGGMNGKRLGNVRLKKCNAYKTIIDNDIPLLFGSDCMPIDPIFGIRSAIFHPIIEQRLNSEQTIRAYTQNWYKLMNKNEFGVISGGCVADLVILNLDPFVSDEQQFREIQVIGTIFNGEIVFNEGLN